MLPFPSPSAFIYTPTETPSLAVAFVRDADANNFRMLIGSPRSALQMLWSGSSEIRSANLAIGDLIEISASLDPSVSHTLLAPSPCSVHSSISSGGTRVAFVLSSESSQVSVPTNLTSAVDQILSRLEPAAEGYLAELRLELSSRVRESLLPALISTERSGLLQSIEKSLRFDFGFGRLLIGLFHGSSSAYRIEHSFGLDSAQQVASIHAPEGHPDEVVMRKLIAEGRACLFDSASGDSSEILRWMDGDPGNGAALIPLHLGQRSLGFIYADRFHSHGLALLREPIESLQRLATAALVTFQQKHEAEELAHRDALTGLYNRRYLNRVIDIEATRMKRYSRPLSLMMVDLCDFKRVNDQHGHVFGDLILRETAQILRNNVREPDIVVRFGGDEFVILLPNTHLDQALIARQRIERAVEERNQNHKDPSTFIALSIGLKTADNANIHRILEDADQQMYIQKTERTKGRIVEVLLGLPGHSSDLLDNVITSLLTSLKKREPFYGGHSQRVAFLCLVMARDLHLPEMDIRSILLAALLHDVGKVSLPGEILRRPGPLDATEREAIQAHPTIGEEFFRGLQYMEDARPIIRHHHERWDGLREGNFPAYPDGLRGEDIPLGARILKIADSMDAMLSERPYKSAQSPDEVCAELRRERGHAFDPKLVDLMMNDTPWEKLSSLEELHHLYHALMNRSDRLGEALSG